MHIHPLTKKLMASGSAPYDEYYGSEEEDVYERYENEYVDDYDSDDFQVRERNYVIHDDEPNEPFFPDEDDTELDAEAFASDLHIMQTQIINMLRTEPQRTVENPTSPTPEAEKAKDGEDACFVCFTNVPDAKFPQCGHSGLCGVCADKLVKSTNKCPLCRETVTSFAKVHRLATVQASDPWKGVKKEGESDAWLDE